MQRPDGSDDPQDPSSGEPSGDSKPFWKQLNIREWVTVGAAVAAAIAAVISALVAYWTYGELDKQRIAMEGQLHEMQAASNDTKNLVSATWGLVGTGKLQATGMNSLAAAGQSQADSMKDLKRAGEAQAKATENLADAGRTQAAATRNLADNSARQLGAIQAGANAAKAQATAVQEQAAATVTASKATDRLADAGQAQSKAVLQSWDVARTANDIASRTAIAADRAWVGVQMPVGDTEPTAAQDYKVDINLSNSGRSPAINALAQVEISLIHISDKTETTLGKCPEGGCQKMTVFPSGSGFSGTSLVYHLAVPAQSMTADEIKKLISPLQLMLLSSESGWITTTSTATPM